MKRYAITSNQNFKSDVVFDVHSELHVESTSNQVSDDVELPRLTLIDNSDVIGNLNDDMIHTEYKRYSEVTSPITMITKV